MELFEVHISWFEHLLLLKKKKVWTLTITCMTKGSRCTLIDDFCILHYSIMFLLGFESGSPFHYFTT